MLDIAFGDPRLPWPHPVCLIGWLIDRLEKFVQSFASFSCHFIKKRHAEKIAGILSLLVACLSFWLSTLIFCRLPLIGPFLALYLAWAGLAAGCLLSTGKLALARVASGSLPHGREAVSWLVTRDTSSMNQTALFKTLADTLSENYTDALLAPLFWLLLLGPAGLWIYKTVSTFDSRWGYRTEKWAHTGWAAARTDDALAWMPARLAPALLWLTHILMKFAKLNKWQGHWPGYVLIGRQAKTMPSPNSGWSMASCAWLCNGRMAGPDKYFGVVIEKGWLGPEKEQARDWTEQQLESLLSLIKAASLIGGLVLWLVFLGLVPIFNYVAGAI